MGFPRQEYWMLPCAHPPHGTSTSSREGQVKNPPEVWETWVRSLGWEEYWEKGMATHSGIHSSGQLFSHVQLFMAPWTAACQAFLSINPNDLFCGSGERRLEGGKA